MLALWLVFSAKALLQVTCKFGICQCSKPLVQTPDAPLFADLGVPFNADGYFAFVAPAGHGLAARAAITEAIEDSIKMEKLLHHQ